MPRPAIRVKGYRAFRATRISLPGHAYLVTTVTQRRERLFADFATARLAISALNHRETRAGGTLHVWVLMPDHLHMVLQLGEEDGISQAMNRIKSHIGRVVNRHLARTGAVWQSGFHEHLLRPDEDLKGIARYVALNPVRAGLVSRAMDYPHWDALWV